jgi:type IV pilus assembly protein PilW
MSNYDSSNHYMNNKYNLENQTGFSLIELMIALGIGIILMLGLANVFISSSSSRNELEKSSAMIENGRYAINILAEDLALSGYYGFFNDIGDTPAPLPDPCVLTATTIQAAMGAPLQGYRSADLDTIPDINTANTCEAALLTAANLTDGSDLLILRRADTATTAAGAMGAKEVYIEQNLRSANILIDGAATGLLRSPSKTGSPAADIRKYHTHVYFIAPCNRASAANGVCAAGDDTTPTLKRLSLGADSTNANTIMEIEPLVEGVEYMKIEYGIDTSPVTENASTGLIGDGIPDSYVTAPTTEAIVSVRVYLLVRSPQATDLYTDTKSYVLGSTSTAGQTLLAAANDPFKRHVYSTEVRPTNIAGRREIPK